MASEPSTEQLQAGHSSLEQPTGEGAVRGADHNSEDVSLDELMMDADDEDLSNAEEPSQEDAVQEIQNGSVSSEQLEVPKRPEKNSAEAAADSDGAEEPISGEVLSNSQPNTAPKELHTPEEAAAEAPAVDVSTVTPTTVTPTTGAPSTVGEPTEASSTEEVADENATDLDLAVVAREAILPLLPVEAASPSAMVAGSPGELPLEGDSSFSEAELAGMVDSLTAPAAATSPGENSAANEASAATGLSIGAKTGDTSPLPALNEAADRPAPAAEPAAVSMPPVAASYVTPPSIPSPEMTLSAMDEDEDDAVTQIGLPLHELEASQVPEVARLQGTPQPTNSPYLPMPPVDSRPSFQRSRSAATVVVSRFNPEMVPGGIAPRKPKAPSVVEALSGMLKKRSREVPAFGSPQLPARRVTSGGLDIAALLPKVSWALFGAGILALGVVWTSQQSAKAGAGTAVQSLQAQSGAEKVEPVEPGPVRKAVKGAAAPAAQSQPSAIDRLAQEEGEVAKTRRAFEQFIASVKSGVEGPRKLRRFMQYATDSATRVPVFRELSSWSNAQGPDMMYALWERAPGGSAAADLAFELLYTSDQRAKASAALSVVLDLREARSCEDYKAILPRVVEHADQRALLSLRPLVHREGCGDDGTEDCYACLRAGSDLSLGIAAAEAKPAPKL